MTITSSAFISLSVGVGAGDLLGEDLLDDLLLLQRHEVLSKAPSLIVKDTVNVSLSIGVETGDQLGGDLLDDHLLLKDTRFQAGPHL